MIFKIIDKSKRFIRLTKERWNHLSKHKEINNFLCRKAMLSLHPEVQHNLEFIKETLKEPIKITNYSFDHQVHSYYRYYKHRQSKAKYLKVIVKYLNGHGFIITVHFVRRIQ